MEQGGVEDGGGEGAVDASSAARAEEGQEEEDEGPDPVRAHSVSVVARDGFV